MPKASTPPREEKTKRPPNAWIIFRSDMNRLLRIEDPKATQSALSKRISDLWATATPEVRAQYERRAEAAKVAHHARYPNYKFAPRKKEEVAREREAKRLAKEEKAKERNARNAQRTSLEAAPPSLYPTLAEYGPLGPSPPGSAAVSPAAFSSREPSPLSLPSEQQIFSPPAEPEMPLAGPSTWALPSTEPQAQPASDDQWDVSSQFASLLHYNVLQNNLDPSLWDPSGVDNVLQPTGDPSIFNLNPFDDHFNGSQELSISMGSLDTGMFNSTWDLDPAFGMHNFDFPSIPSAPDFQQNTPYDMSSELTPGESQGSPYDMNNNSGFDSFDLPAEIPASQVASSSTQPFDEAAAQHQQQQQANTSSYAPPSGAIYAGNRRVGGTWAQYSLPEADLSSHSYAVTTAAQ